jgi:hypothetical protein
VSRDTRDEAGLGLRVKSGWAAFVVLQSGEPNPRLVSRGRLELSDPKVPESRQPHHAAFGTEQKDGRIVERLIAIVRRAAEQSVGALLTRCRDAGVAIGAAGLVVGSDVDPASIANPHIRAHASEGRLFGRAAEDALRAAGIPSAIWIEKALYADAARLLGEREPSIRRAVTALGRDQDGGWRAEDKAAALAAWLSLVQLRSTG